MLIATGDILKIRQGLLIHQVNCLGKTGYLAGALRRQWPNHFQAYFDAVRSQVNVGDALGSVAVSFSAGHGIAHVFGQVQIGPNTDLQAVDTALGALAAKIASDRALKGVKVVAPFQMGCGRGGGDWTKYSALLSKHFPDILVIRNSRFT